MTAQHRRRKQTTRNWLQLLHHELQQPLALADALVGFQCALLPLWTLPPASLGPDGTGMCRRHTRRSHDTDVACTCMTLLAVSHRHTCTGTSHNVCRKHVCRADTCTGGGACCIRRSSRSPHPHHRAAPSTIVATFDNILIHNVYSSNVYAASWLAPPVPVFEGTYSCNWSIVVVKTLQGPSSGSAEAWEALARRGTAHRSEAKGLTHVPALERASIWRRRSTEPDLLGTIRPPRCASPIHTVSRSSRNPGNTTKRPNTG